jgi:hypothetical protein
MLFLSNSGEEADGRQAAFETVKITRRDIGKSGNSDSYTGPPPLIPGTKHRPDDIRIVHFLT